jgi:predicted nucleic acid-binding protein
VKILDSDHWIALLRGKLDLRGRVAADEGLAITAISVGKLVYGAERATRPAEKLLELDTLLAGITVVAYDNPAARRFGALKMALERRGERLDDADLQIAAIAEHLPDLLRMARDVASTPPMAIPTRSGRHSTPSTRSPTWMSPPWCPSCCRCSTWKTIGTTVNCPSCWEKSARRRSNPSAPTWPTILAGPMASGTHLMRWRSWLHSTPRCASRC